MRRTRKNESNSSSTRLGKKKGKKSKSSLNKSSSRKLPKLIKKVRNNTRKNPARTPLRVTKHRTQKTRKTRTGKRSPAVQVTRKISFQNTRSRSRVRRSPSKKQTTARTVKKKIIRVLGHGQFSVDSETLRKLNAIDNSIVRRLEKENLTDEEFKMKIEQLGDIVTKKGKLLDPKVIVGSDIILPGGDLTIGEASKIFHGEGIIPGLE
jgi:hypothetical protein